MVDAGITEQDVNPILREVGIKLLTDPPYYGVPDVAVMAVMLSAQAGAFAAQVMDLLTGSYDDPASAKAAIADCRLTLVMVAATAVAMVHTLDTYPSGVDHASG